MRRDPRPAHLLVEHDSESIQVCGHAPTRGQCAAVSSVFYARQVGSLLDWRHGYIRLDRLPPTGMDETLAALRALRRAWPGLLRIRRVRRLPPRRGPL